MNQQDKIIHSMKTAKMSDGVNVRANEDQKLPEIQKSGQVKTDLILDCVISLTD